MHTINLKTIMAGLDYPTSGAALFNEIKIHLADSDRIIINMEGVDTLPSMFLNTSLGVFIDNYGKELLRAKISFIRVTKSQAERLKDYFLRY